jgi:hypothetical protein
MVVIDPSGPRPWKPVNTGITPAAQSALSPAHSMPSMRARPCTPEVLTGSCSAL